MTQGHSWSSVSVKVFNFWSNIESEKGRFKYVSFEDEGVTRVTAFIAIAEDEPSLGKVDARSVYNLSLQNKITRLNLDNESLRDKVADLKKVIEKWTSSKVILDQLLTEQVPGDIVCALGEEVKGRKKISSKEIMFIKGENSPS
ncbi:hypothetical protein Tco_0835391 [Tanacetum coccineum]